MIVLDSSALLAIAFEERGAQRAIESLPQAVMSAANLAEVLSVAERNGRDSEGVFSDIAGSGLRILPVEAGHARIAAQILRAHPRLNLSLGDRLCLALAIHLPASVLTSDREMTKVGMGLQVELFR